MSSAIPETKPQGPRSIWTAPGFVYLWAAQLVSSMGDEFYGLALSWLVYDITGSAKAMGTVRALELLPNVALGLFFGVLLDRFDRRRIMQIAAAMIALVVLLPSIFSATGSLTMAHVYFMAITVSGMRLLYMTGLRTLVPLMVERPHLMQANAAVGLLSDITRILGPVAAGFLISAVSPLRVLWLDALSFVFPIIMLNRIQIPEFQRKRKTASSSVLGDIREGLVVFRTNRALFSLMILSLTVNIGLGMMQATLVFHTRSVFLLDAMGASMLLSLGGFGSILASLLVYHFKRHPRGKAIAVSCSLIGVALAIMAVVRTPSMFGVVYLFAMGSVTTANILIRTTIQERVTADLLGRVISTTQMLARIMASPSAFVGGYIADSSGSKLVLALAAGVVIGAGVIGWFGVDYLPKHERL